MGKEFASDVPRDENSWLLFKRDATYRRSITPEEIQKDVAAHPSKMNYYLCSEIVKYVSESGDTILDPFGGAGTTMLACQEQDRKAVLIELEPHYYNILYIYNKHYGNRHMLVHNDCNRAMPIPCDHVITSPPYGNDMFKEKGALMRNDKHTNRLQEVMNYAAHFQNLGRLSPFFYVQTLQHTLELMVESVKPGGTITITHRDRIREGKRITYAFDIMKVMRKLGADIELHDKWKVPGALQATYNKKRGIAVIEEEDILIFRKRL